MNRMGVTIDSWINQNVPEASVVIVRGNETEVLTPKEAREKYYDVVPKKASEFEHILPGHKFAVCKLIFEL